MIAVVHFLILLPIVGFLASLFIAKQNETLLSWTAFSVVGLHLLVAIGLAGYWVINQTPVLDIKELSLYKTAGYDFFIDFHFDEITAVYLLVGALLTFMVTLYSRYYLHRESGYKRFFNTVLFFYIGYNVVIFSGNLETLFVGWEVLGISSFLLIAFYRDRYLPVKNAVKVFSIYRIGDVGLILAMWMSHHLFHENITFERLGNYELVHEHLQNHSWVGVFISLMILISAAAKSAQLPFSSWLPRAMEGPTPSTAIFYGSLSVHIGVFILLRTYPFWEQQTSVRVLIVLLGLTTSLVATLTARVQSSIKSQIAYSSVAQIGLIFVEVALGFEKLALFHFAGNAFLRTYQLLVSPSVVSYLIREQFYNFVPKTKSIENSWPRRIEYSLYMLSLKEWNLDAFMYQFLWNPVKKVGNRLNFITIKGIFIFFVLVYGAGLFAVYHREAINPKLVEWLPIVFSLVGLIMVLKSFTERKNAYLSWLLIVMNHFWVALAVAFNDAFDFNEVHLYLSGIVVLGIVGYLCLRRLKSFEGGISLDCFHGHSFEHPKIAIVFFLACLGVSGFPISPTFIGEDLIFSHIQEHQYVLAVFVTLSFLLDGLSLIRIYARVFLGPHIKTYHEIAYRSS